MCQLQSGKINFFSPGKMDIFPHSVLFFHWALPKICNSDPLLNHCFKYFVASKHFKTFQNISKLAVFQLM